MRAFCLSFLSVKRVQWGCVHSSKGFICITYESITCVLRSRWNLRLLWCFNCMWKKREEYVSYGVGNEFWNSQVLRLNQRSNEGPWSKEFSLRDHAVHYSLNLLNRKCPIKTSAYNVDLNVTKAVTFRMKCPWTWWEWNSAVHIQRYLPCWV